MTRTPPALALEGCGRVWGDRVALRDVTLSLPAGQRVAIAGPSGGGKTTLLRLLGGALEPSSGVVRADGDDLSRLSVRGLTAHRARCGIVHQHALLVGQLSVHANVTAGRLGHWSPLRTLASMVVPQERERTRVLLDRVGLADRQWDRASELSGGQQQRVAIARAMASAPSVILADEPTASLDPTTAAEVVELLLRSAEGATLVISTHWTSQVLPHVDRLLGIREGQLTLDRPADEVTEGDLDALYAGSRERR
ncbi:MAG: ATP-binding cassette domain-containing protein [Myxococcota bacterium]|nr:ATP-binding cassette domain-containing protein [Myxococcota bacterium]